MKKCQGCNEEKPENELLETDCCHKLKCGQCANPCDISCHHWLCCLCNIKVNTCFGICPENHFRDQDASILLNTDYFLDEEDHNQQRREALRDFDESLGKLDKLTCLQKLLVSEFKDVNDGNLKLRCVNPFHRIVFIG
jgi:hypothetical protein